MSTLNRRKSSFIGKLDSGILSVGLGLFMIAIFGSAGLVNASVDEGVAAIQAQLPSTVTVANAPHSMIIPALRNASRAEPEKAVDIAAGVVRERWSVINGDASTSVAMASDGKSVIDSKSVVLDDEGKAALLVEMADAIIEGATEDGQTPDALLVSAVLQAMMFALPPDVTMIGALLNEGVLASLPPGVVVLVSRSLRSDGAYQFTAPPNAQGGEKGEVPPKPTPTPKPRPRPTPRPVTPVVNN